MIYAKRLPRAIQHIKCEFCKNHATWMFREDKDEMVLLTCNTHKRLLEVEYNETSDSIHGK